MEAWVVELLSSGVVEWRGGDITHGASSTVDKKKTEDERARTLLSM